MSDQSFDAIVIGAGPLGEVCAGELADGGLRVAIVERSWSRASAASGPASPRRRCCARGRCCRRPGRRPGAREAVTGKLDVAEALGWRNFMVSDWDDSGQLPWLEEKGIELVRGQGRLAGPGKVDVDGTTYEAESIVVATGSDPVIPPIDGLEGLEGIWTNREATAVKEIPASLLILGGGPVGVEMAPGIRPDGHSGDDRRGRAAAAAARGAARSARRWPRACAAEGIRASPWRLRLLGVARRRQYVLGFEGGDELRGREAAGRDRAPAADRGHRP